MRKQFAANAVNYKPLDDRDDAIILALADNNMRVTETSYALNIHRNTVMYRLEKIKQLTRLDPLNFYDLHKLVEIVKTGETSDG